MSLGVSHPAAAIPSFARQTGMECNACHTVYPQLNSVGREFKASGYSEGDVPFFEKFSAWAQGSFTHTAKDQTDNAADGYGTNDNWTVDQLSLFYGGKVVGKVGAFVQITYDGVEKGWSWDNVDIRYADSTTMNGKDLQYGVSINNNPTVQDLFNSTPAWGFPFDGSALAPGPAAATLIEGGLGQISYGVTAYGLYNDTLYAEAGFYHMLSRSLIGSLTGDASGTPGSRGIAPYWRLAIQKDEGANFFSVGTFGMAASLYPDGHRFVGSDHYTDVGFDATYQRIADNYDVTARASLIFENQRLDASHALGDADNVSNTLHSFNTSVSYTYDHTYGATLGMVRISGDPDPALYGTLKGSPNSTEFIVEGDWLPFHKKPLGAYPWFNPKLTLQYVAYASMDGQTNNVDGMGRHASDNNTLFVLTTLTF
ncbi:hypothetical protein [Kordiimonas marina]|uniref:hypothetical protein n=1 Tax=Kordiimonas marina TaxID=2872312 RepID=UPI001FF6E64B|nr:hypothetical protein [Kordiimonas marina]MCJ9429226.1 hypothetical protein [Kordiimonas marina]